MASADSLEVILFQSYNYPGVRRLMRLMGLMAIYLKPRQTTPGLDMTGWSK